MDITQEIARYADKYRADGFTVQVLDETGRVPDLPGVEGADLVATRNGERVVVQVKQSLAELRRDDQSGRIADAVQGKPGWRYDLIVLGQPARSEDVVTEASEPPANDILQSIARAEQLTRAGDTAVACLAVWAALEAAMRFAARRAGLEVQSNEAAYLVRRLYSHGLLDATDFDGLNAALRIRNTIAHGLAIPSIDPHVLSFVANLARKLIASSGRSDQDAA